MKYIILLRHAKSSWKYPQLSDFQRPLNKRGKKAAKLMGQKLATKTIQPQLIISSPAKRAYKTAKKVAKKIQYPKNSIQFTQNLYHASLQELVQIIVNIDNNYSKIMLVAHNPTITSFANKLLNDHKFDNIPTAGMVTIRLAINSWREITHNLIESQLVDYDYPKKT